MTRWTGRVIVPLEIAITLDHDATEYDDDLAETTALRRIEEYLQTISGDRQGIVVMASGTEQALRMHVETPSRSLEHIAKVLGVGKSSVSRALDKAAEDAPSTEIQQAS